jgi:hypothetical protein
MATKKRSARPKGLQYFEERHRQQQVQLLKQRAARLGLLLVAPEVV